MKMHTSSSPQALLVALLAVGCLLAPRIQAAETQASLKDITLQGGLSDGKARLVIEALLDPSGLGRQKLIYATRLEQAIQVNRTQFVHDVTAKFDILQGEPKELALTIGGEGDIRDVAGEALQDWSVRKTPEGTRLLVLRPRQKEKEPQPGTIEVRIKAEQKIPQAFGRVEVLAFTPPQPALFHGDIVVRSAEELAVKPGDVSGLMPLEARYLPEWMRPASQAGSDPLAFRFQGGAYSLALNVSVADPEARTVALRNFKLTGRIDGLVASFGLSAMARVRDPKGGTLDLLSGRVGLTELQSGENWRVKFQDGRFVLAFDRPGDFPIQVRFRAAVQQADGWKRLDFQVAPSTLLPIVLSGLPEDTRFQFTGAARPERRGADFVSFLPPNGAVDLAWKEAQVDAEGKLFFAVEMLSQITISPGLMSQAALLDFKVMQGELTRVVLELQGPGEVTRVQGDRVLAWNTEAITNSPNRRLVVQLNQPQKDQFSIQVHLQAPLGAFPQTVETPRVRPEGATRFSGHYRVVNEGAVRLEVTQASGLSQISPEQFPETDASKALFRPGGGQRFAYRFSGTDFALRIEAGQILPELSVSQVLAYHLAETEQSIDAEVELDIREAALRDLVLTMPRGWALARLNVPGLADYFTREPADRTDAELRLVYAAPVIGRQVFQLRLERNQSLNVTNWLLPRLEVNQAKSVRGHVGISADAGFRLTPEGATGLTEIATAYFPRKTVGLQVAYRISEPTWEASVRVERLPQTVQADALHLFSVGEGVAYGSSVINYLVSSAPVSSFRLELSSEYANVEFTGKDIRGWQKLTNGYLVQLHTPVSGAYTLLATYERPFRSQGETLTFTGARPSDAQPEQGYTLVVSGHQFQVQPVEVSPGLLPLEAGEVPAEYRVFIESPILAAYRYTSRPFTLRLALSPIAQGESLSQVVDRASLTTRISKAGQVLTDARYFVKNRGNTHFRLALPVGTFLWSAMVNGTAVVPVIDGSDNLLPLPQRLDPNAPITVDVQVASPTNHTRRIRIAAPVVSATPVMLAEWNLQADTGQQLIYRGGSLTPVLGTWDASGFAQLARMFTGEDRGRAWQQLAAAAVLTILGLVVIRTTVRSGAFRGSLRHMTGAILGTLALVLGLAALASLFGVAQSHQTAPPRDLAFVAPVQSANQALTVEVATVEAKPSFARAVGYAWPVVLALAVWCCGLLFFPDWHRAMGWVLGWGFLAWAALRWPNGVPGLLVILICFFILHVAVPALRCLARAPRAPAREPAPAAANGVSASTVAIGFLAGLLWLSGGSVVSAETQAVLPPQQAQLAVSCEPLAPPIQTLPESVHHQMRIEEAFVLGTVKIRWRASTGETLPLLSRAAVLTEAEFPTNLVKLFTRPSDSGGGQWLAAQTNGMAEITARYQIAVTKGPNGSGFFVPSPFGLVNQLDLVLAGLDVDVHSTAAVSVQRDFNGQDTTAKLVLSPTSTPWLGWKPRSRDLAREKLVFYTELAQLYVPSAGVIEGVHHVAVRPAQGELSELAFRVPAGATVSDVTEPAQAAASPPEQKAVAARPLVSLWRFDPDQRRLRVSLRAPQSRPFTLIVRTQVPTAPLPYEQVLGLLTVEGAAGQIGLFGIATGSEVQLDNVTADGSPPLNIEDFPAAALESARKEIAGLSLRRAYRSTDLAATARIRASAVQPDVRVESQQTLSLGEDRTVLAVNANVTITRAGIFRLSFALPTGFEVESISGQALSHWTDLRSGDERIVALHLRGKTEGATQFSISLAGAGLKPSQGWTVPRWSLREAVKQQGTMLVAPEQGMRLQVAARDGLTQLDPQKAGVKQKGVLLFRLLQEPWSLGLDIEQVDPWIQVNSLQHALVSEALVKVTANLQFQIENTGLKALRLGLPADAESVRFRGDQVADFRLVADAPPTNGLRVWEVKLHRRILGAYALQVHYQAPMAERATQTTLRGIQAMDVNVQRGFLAVQAGGRLQLRTTNAPPTLQPTEWQTIPRTLQQDLQTASANLTYRLIEPAFELPIAIERHTAARLMAARVHETTLSSVLSDNGEMLTHVRLNLTPGDKRLVHLTLPEGARFWFAFANHAAVSPWREQDRILLPLEPQSQPGQQMTLEFFYSSQAGRANPRALDLELLAPKFDLPLENVTWRVFLNEKWRLKDWTGSLQLAEQQVASAPAATANVQVYLQNEATVQRAKTQEAEQMLAYGNSALQQGNPEQARRAFQAAYGLSQGDNAFNEDARVQLNNLKVQQALVGLNVRQAAVAGETDAFAGRLRELTGGKVLNYTPQDAKAIIERGPAEENAAFNRLAQRLIDQQQAAVSLPAAIRASIPEQGRMLTFKRAVVADTWADLRIGLEARSAQSATWRVRLFIFVALLVALGILGGAARKVSENIR
ncbi:MAG: hypothetical protein AB9869_00460 [Verrucomicrobiia bacterium]